MDMIILGLLVYNLTFYKPLTINNIQQLISELKILSEVKNIISNYNETYIIQASNEIVVNLDNSSYVSRVIILGGKNEKP